MSASNWRIGKIITASLLAASLALINTLPALAIIVQYDTNFSGDGYHIVNASPYITNEVTYDLAVQTDGKMVVAGGHIPDTSFNQEGTIRRFNTDGTPDSSFGTAGVLSLDIGTTGTTQFDSVAVQSDGKIVVSGEVINNSAAPAGWDRDAIVARLTSTGTLDTSFSSNGYEVYDSLAGTPYLTDNFRDISIDSGGNIVLTGSSGLVGVVVRLSTAGLMDATFSADGVEIVDIGGQDSLSSLSIDSSGSIYATGYSSSASQDLLVVKLSSVGVPDSSFDGDGYAIFNSLGGAPTSSDYGQNIEVDGANIVISGMTSVIGQSLSNTGFIARITSSGTLDPAFSGDGIFVMPDNDWIEGLAVLEDYYYVVGADFKTSIGPADSSLWRFTNSGALDTDFDGDGQFKLLELNHFTATWGILYGVEVVDGEIYLAGTPFDDATSAEVTSIAKIVFGNQVVNLPPNTGLTDSGGNPITTPLSGTQTVQLEQSTLGIPVVEFDADFTNADVDLTGVTVDSSIVDGKAVVHGLVGTHTVFVPKRGGDNTVIICPDATVLAEVQEGCVNQVTLTEADPNVEIVNVNGQDFWKVSGLTGTGGLSITVVLAGSSPILSPTGEATLQPTFVLLLVLIVAVVFIIKGKYRQSL